MNNSAPHATLKNDHAGLNSAQAILMHMPQKLLQMQSLGRHLYSPCDHEGMCPSPYSSLELPCARNAMRKTTHSSKLKMTDTGKHLPHYSTQSCHRNIPDPSRSMRVIVSGDVLTDWQRPAILIRCALVRITSEWEWGNKLSCSVKTGLRSMSIRYISSKLAGRPALY